MPQNIDPHSQSIQHPIYNQHSQALGNNNSNLANYQKRDPKFNFGRDFETTGFLQPFQDDNNRNNQNVDPVLV